MLVGNINCEDSRYAPRTQFQDCLQIQCCSILQNHEHIQCREAVISVDIERQEIWYYSKNEMLSMPFFYRPTEF